MASELQTLIKTLDLEELDVDLYRGVSPQVGWQRVYGGQVIGQALAAALRTVDDARPAHSLHGYFIRPGDPKLPIIYSISRDRDGGSFSSRRVIARQHGQAIFTMSASFQAGEDGFEHQATMPEVTMPEDLPGEKEFLAVFADRMPANMKRYFGRDRPIEMRPVNTTHYLDPQVGEPPVQNVWIRAVEPLPENRAVHQAVLAYASDMTILDTALAPHGHNLFDGKLVLASLDHALWFHRRFRADEWLLYAQESPSSSGGRGFNRGLVFTRDGRLVASVAQEGMMRARRKR